MIDWSNYTPLGKAQYRGGTGSRLHQIKSLTREEALHFLLHDPHGRQLRRDFHDVSFDALADHVCEASRRPTEKREVPTMDDHLKAILKSESACIALCKHITANGGSGFTHSEFDRKVLEPYARNKFPALHPGAAIAKVLSEEIPVAKAYETVHAASYPDAVAKAQPGVGDPDEEDVADEEEEDKDEKEDEDARSALEELNALAEQERRRTSGMSKAVAFSRIYTDPSNAALVRRERRQSLAKMMAR
jgi:hypothetical protein